MNTKKDIIERLFKDGHIDFNEMWILLQEDNTSKFIPMPYPVYPSYPVYTLYPNQPYWYISNSTDVTTSE